MTEPFRETQRLPKWLYWLIATPIAAVATWLFVQQILLGKPVGDKPAPDWFIILYAASAAVILPLMIWSFKLVTTIDQSAITYRLSPLHFRTKRIPWSEVQESFIRKYKPMREYGGWGLRYGFRNGWAFNMKGNMGMQLVLRNGKRILIGTQRPEELRAYLVSLGKNTGS